MEDRMFNHCVEQVGSAKLTFNAQSVEYQAPGIGKVRFGWEGPLRVAGKIVDVDNFSRYDNPYVQAEFDPIEIHVKANDKEPYLNWDTGERQLV